MKRMIFLENPEGKKIGTFTAWWHYHENTALHNVYWVGIRPEYQGKHGLGKALIARGIQLMIENDGPVAFYSHTQPCSFRAITIYRQLGFEFYEEEANFMGYRNETHLGVELLKNLKLLKF
ncbi:MAG: GNAT family N-acetyltransferase [Clostridia bacterium]|nr:GNAT family N-acetyltransferase [Clostridia bacterium]